MVGKTFNGETRTMILKVLKFFEAEKANRQYIIPVDQVIKRTAAATGVCKNTILRIKKEAARMLAEPDASVELTSSTFCSGPLPVLPTPGKTRKKISKKTNLTPEQLATLKSIVDGMKFPTLRKILAVAKSVMNFDGKKATMRKILIRKLGYSFQKSSWKPISETSASPALELVVIKEEAKDETEQAAVPSTSDKPKDTNIAEVGKPNEARAIKPEDTLPNATEIITPANIDKDLYLKFVQNNAKATNSNTSTPGTSKKTVTKRASKKQKTTLTSEHKQEPIKSESNIQEPIRPTSEKEVIIKSENIKQELIEPSTIKQEPNNQVVFMDEGESETESSDDSDDSMS